MVIHFSSNLSSKLSHLAQSFKPQHHFNFIRNAVPSSGSSTTSNVYTNSSLGGTSNSNNNNSNNNTTGTGSSGSAGGAGGAKYNAGSRAPNWGFASQGRIVQGTTTTTDINQRSNDEELEIQEVFPFRSVRLLGSNSKSNLSKSSNSRGLGRPRSNSLSSSASPSTSSSATASTSTSNKTSGNVVNSEETNSSKVRLSSSEMQSRYRSAFSKGEITEEIREMELEADEMDLGPRQSLVKISGRRASISRSSTLLLTSSSTLSSHSNSSNLRAIHTSSITSTPIPSSSSITPATSFPFSSPPLADKPRARRNSTSAVASTSPSLNSDSSIPIPSTIPTSTTTNSKPKINIDEAINKPVESRRLPSLVKRPSATSMKDVKPPTSYGNEDGELERRNLAALKNAETSLDTKAAVRIYLAHPTQYTVQGHNAAMEALHRVRTPQDSINPIVEIFNQLFDHELLKPNRISFTHMLRTFIDRDEEILKNIELIERRVLKKKLGAKARGPWWVEDPVDNYMNPQEAEELVRLQKEDYFTPALKIFNALGPNANTLNNDILNSLVVAAVTRNRLDVAIALFARLESAPDKYPDGSCYAALIKAFGKEKDKEGVMEIFESYLLARTQGLPEPPKRIALAGSRYKTVNTKHKYSTQVQYLETVGPKYAFSMNDAAVWRETTEALFMADDSVAAVELVERMMNQSEGKLTPGYPIVDSSNSLAMIRGFLMTGDEESAQIWFDRIANPLVKSSKRDISLSFIFKSYSAALDRAASSTSTPASLDFFNHVYRTALCHLKSDDEMGQLVTAIDVNLAAIYSTDDYALRNKYMDTVLEFKSKFSALKPAEFSSGLQERVIAALGYLGRLNESVDAYVVYADTILKIIRTSRNVVEVARSNNKWVLKSTGDITLAALGLLPTPSLRTYEFKYNKNIRPTLKQLTTVVSKANAIFRSENFPIENCYELLVAETYLKSKSAAKGDIKSLDLSGPQWFTVIEAFAFVARFETRQPAKFDFPGFEPIIDDFVSSGIVLEQSENFNFPNLVKLLRQAGMSKDRVLAVISVLDSRVGDAIANGDIDLSSLPTPAVSPSPIPIDTPPTSNNSPSPTFNEQPNRPLPTPPSTPPTYFATLPNPLPLIENPIISLPASQIIEDALRGDVMKAYQFARGQVENGQYPHPETLGRLVEALGRAGHLNELRRTYVMAYTTLGSLSHDLPAQSRAWIALEDHMIVALAQCGVIAEVNIHRNRLIAAGSAPSADGYAAMILNMKETTDNAAVALELFEESQRYGVAPNVYLFNTLISKLSRARRSKEAIDYFELMKATGIQPSSITYGAVINACCKSGDSTSAEFLFNEMVNSPGFKPRVPPYNTMIQFFTQTQPDREKALFYYDKLLAAGVQPTGHTYKLLLDAYGAIGTPDAESMSDVFDRLLADKKVTVTGPHWASLVNAWGCVQKDLDRATSIFDSIAHHPSTQNSEVPLPDAVVYESLLNACIANQRPDLCDKYLKQMQENGVKMTAYVANTLIRAHAAQGDIESARAIFATLSDPLPGVAAEGNHLRERHTVVESESKQTDQVFAEPSTYDIMVRSEINCGDTSKALELYERVKLRCYPAAVVARIAKVLTEAGLTILPEQKSETVSSPPQ